MRSLFVSILSIMSMIGAVLLPIFTTIIGLFSVGPEYIVSDGRFELTNGIDFSLSQVWAFSSAWHQL